MMLSKTLNCGSYIFFNTHCQDFSFSSRTYAIYVIHHSPLGESDLPLRFSVFPN